MAAFMDKLVHSKAYKEFMSKLYGWGASVVIIGALFKIQHWPGAGIMLTCGLGTEALIFFMSAFEPLHVEYDWSLVYPELAGMFDEDGKEKKTITQELDDMLEKAKIGPELIESLGVGLKKLSESSSKLSDVTGASFTTNEYIENMKGASASVKELSETYRKTSDGLSKDLSASEDYVNSIRNAAQSANELSSSYTQVAQSLKEDISVTEDYANSIKSATDSINELADNYKKSSDVIARSAEALDFSSVEGGSFNENLRNISKNLAALNSVYELQLQSSNEYLQITNKLQEGMEQFTSNLNESIDFTARYKDEAANLTKNIAALNTVYGNMLSAMNFPKDKK